ncbi:MAG: radical SAM protein [Candidatus Methylomirabilota bacterium]
MSWPAYLELHQTGELQQRAKAAERLLEPCRVCPRECLAQRLQGETGVCGVAENAMISSYGPHYGEERPLVGTGGSGTIFLAHCNLCCVFCQNYEISQEGEGQVVPVRRLAEMMLDLQRMGCHNINFVTPTHQVPQILRALPLAVEGGLQVPLVYNCGGYESLETLRILDGVFDIYMPDFKYGDSEAAKRYSNAENYPEVAKAAFQEMIARRGLLVRHLVLPNNLAGTGEVVRFLAELSEDTYVNIMAQYRPCYRAHEYPPLARRPTREELEGALRLARAAGLHRLDGYC